MAKATKKLVEVERVVKDKVEVVILELSLEEATTLVAILGDIAGDGVRRKHVDAIYHTLVTQGVKDGTKVFDLTPYIRD